jgi:hypothetical protein
MSWPWKHRNPEHQPSHQCPIWTPLLSSPHPLFLCSWCHLFAPETESKYHHNNWYIYHDLIMRRSNAKDKDAKPKTKTLIKTKTLFEVRISQIKTVLGPSLRKLNFWKYFHGLLTLTNLAASVRSLPLLDPDNWDQSWNAFVELSTARLTSLTPEVGILHRTSPASYKYLFTNLELWLFSPWNKIVSFSADDWNIRMKFWALKWQPKQTEQSHR